MVADRWIISRLERSIETVQKAVHAYRFDMAAKEIHDLVWNRYCDWYLEFCKATLNAEELGEPAKAGCRWTMVRVLETILRLAHPIMPFITEEIWQRIAPLAGAGGETIMTRSYPEHDASRVDAEAEQEMKWVMELILGVRRIRGEMDISPGKRVPLLLSGADGADREMMERNRRYLDTVGRLLSMDVLDPEENEPESSVTIVDSMRLLIPLEGLIDRQAERTRLKKELDRIDKEILRIGHKLDNPNFLNKAPAAVVEKEREKLSACQREKQELSLQMTKLD